MRVRSQDSEAKWNAQDSPAVKQGLAPGMGMDGPEGEVSEAPSAGKSFLQKQGSRSAPPWQEQRAGGRLPFTGQLGTQGSLRPPYASPALGSFRGSGGPGSTNFSFKEGGGGNPNSG